MDRECAWRCERFAGQPDDANSKQSAFAARGRESGHKLTELNSQVMCVLCLYTSSSVAIIRLQPSRFNGYVYSSRCMAFTLLDRSRALGYCWPGVVLFFALLAALLMPVALNKIAARGIGKLASPVQHGLALSNSSRSRALNTTANTSKASNASKANSSTSPTAVRSFSGKSNMSTQQFKYRDPIVFNARDKHTGAAVSSRIETRLAPCSAEFTPGRHYASPSSCHTDTSRCWNIPPVYAAALALQGRASWCLPN